MWGINGETGEIVKMDELGIWEPLSVKLQTYKTAVEVRMLLCIYVQAANIKRSNVSLSEVSYFQKNCHISSTIFSNISCNSSAFYSNLTKIFLTFAEIFRNISSKFLNTT